MLESEENLAVYLYSQVFMQSLIIKKEQGRQHCLYLPGTTALFAYIWYEKDEWYLCLLNHKKTIKLLFHNIYTHTYQGNEQIQILVTLYKRHQHAMYPYQLTRGLLNIGRGEENTIVILHPYVSSIHASLFVDEGNIVIKDCESSNGIYVNGQRVDEMLLHCGDVLTIMDITLIMGDTFLMIPIHDPAIELHHMELYHGSNKKLEMAKNHIWSHAMPFPIPVWKSLQQHIEAPACMNKKSETPLWVILGPSFMMGSASLSMGIFTFLRLQQSAQDQMQAIPSILMSLSMALSTILWPILNRRYDQNGKKREFANYHKAYTEYLQRKHNENLAYCESEKEYINTYFEYTRSASLYLTERHELLFHRQPQHFGWMDIVLGKGNQNASITVDYPIQEFQVMEDDLYEELTRVANTPYILKEIPIKLNLLDIESIGIIGIRDECVRYALMLLLQIALLHDIHHLQIILIIDANTANQYGLSWIPHLHFLERRLIISDVSDIVSLQEYVTVNRAELMSKTLLIMSFQSDLEQEFSIIQSWMEDEHQKCCYMQCAVMLEELKPSCHTYIALHNKNHQLYHEDQLQAIQETIYSYEELSKSFRELGYYHLRYTEHVHKIITFFDLYPCGNVEQLHILERWKQNKRCTTLKAIIGNDHNKQPIYLDIHEHAHGPHGLIAGTTGSGKSECIITYILSMAISYSSEQISLYLIDYKGGMSASAMKDLPHVCGIMTNLNDELIIRTEAALEYEIKYRQKTLLQTAQDYQKATIDIYQYQILRASQKELRPLPHLIIIADEFAELKMQHPAFLEYLKQIARIGRSLGIHLVLSTQKPGGIVDDQIWSNSHFHLCLKVQERSDSMEILKRDDAAYLREPGSFCLQIGNDELFQTGRCAWTQAPYHDQSYYEMIHDDEITIVDYTLKKQQTLSVKKECVDKQSQLQAVIQKVRQIHNEYHYFEDKLVNDPLAEIIYLEQIKNENDFVLMGMLDDIFHKEQKPFYINAYQTMFICGRSSNDRLWFLQNYIIGLLHARINIQLYIFDFEENFSSSYEPADIVHDVVKREEHEKVKTFFNHMERRLKDKIDNLEALTSICIVINGYESFHEYFSDWEAFIITLVREGEKRRIYIMFLMSDFLSCNYRLQSLAHHIYIMCLENKQDYKTILHANIYPIEQLGSGLLKAGENTILFQLGTYRKETYIHLLSESFKPKKAIPILPTVVTYTIDVGQGLCLGIDLKYKELYFLAWDEWTHIYIFSNSLISTVFLNSIQKQCNTKEMIDLSVIQCSEIADLDDDKILQMHTKRIAWGNVHDARRMVMHPNCQSVLQNAIIMMIGSGLQDIFYALQLTAQLKQSEITANQAAVWRRGQLQWIQIIEGEDNG